MIENVPELLTWGPLDDHGRPIKKKKGQIFDAFINSLRSLNYNVDWRIINCADYGDPTLRQRLIILCRKDKAVIWPDSSHADPDNCPPDKLPWRAAKSSTGNWQETASLAGRGRSSQLHCLEFSTGSRSSAT
jgi:DNA (cytosine-5)-methyltransferase 1